MLCISVASEVPPSAPIDDYLLEDLPLSTLESLFLDSLQLFLIESHPLWIEHWLAHALTWYSIFLTARRVLTGMIASMRLFRLRVLIRFCILKLSNLL